MSKTEEQAWEIALPITEELGLELVDVEFVKEGGNWYLRYFIDKEEGVDFNDCQNLSKALDSLLDEKDFIKNSYSLEVSSPGLDRPLKRDKDFLRFAGSDIDISLFKALQGEKKFTCRLDGLSEDGRSLLVTLKDGSQVELERSSIAGVRLTVSF